MDYLGYHSFVDHEDPSLEYGCFEVFHVSGKEARQLSRETGEEWRAGYYWWPCFPGCLPDSDRNGPFRSAKAAWKDAREN